jgi:hypothetical protein
MGLFEADNSWYAVPEYVKAIILLLRQLGERSSAAISALAEQ